MSRKMVNKLKNSKDNKNIKEKREERNSFFNSLERINDSCSEKSPRRVIIEMYL